MRPILSICLLLLACLSLGAAAHAQVRLLPYVGYQFHAGLDVERAFSEPRPLDSEGGVLIGFGVDVPVSLGPLPFTLKVRPSAETAFVPGATDTFDGGEAVEVSQRFIQVSGDVIAEFSVPGTSLMPFAGLGLAYAHYSARFDERGYVEVVGNAEVDGWAIGPNVVGGFRVGAGRVAPFLQARYSFTDPSPTFSAETSGSEIGHGFAVVMGASIGL